MLIGVGEALITVLVLTAVYRARPWLMSAADGGTGETRTRPFAGMLIYGGLIISGPALCSSCLSPPNGPTAWRGRGRGRLRRQGRERPARGLAVRRL